MNTVPSTDYVALAQLLSHIVLRYLVKLHAICVIWDASTTDFNNTLNEMLKLSNNAAHRPPGVYYESSPPNFYLIMTTSSSANTTTSGTIWLDDELLSKDLETAIDFGCQAFIASTDVAVSFLRAYLSVIFGCVQRYSKSHFVFVQSSDKYRDETESILKHPAVHEMSNVLIITAGQTSKSYTITTNRFMGRYDNTKSVLLDTFNGDPTTMDRLDNLFPDKITDLQGRIVRVALFNYIPYSVWEEVPAGTGNANAQHTVAEKNLSIDGTESRMMIQFCVRHNCTLEISLDEAGEWGEIWDNRSGNGVLGAVAEGRADVGISALYEWYHEYQFLDFSRPISRTGITCIVPRPQLLSGLFLPAMPFSWQLWVGVFVSLIVGALSLIGIEQVYQRRRTGDIESKSIVMPPDDAGTIVFQTVAIYLFQSSSMMSKPVAERIILCCILLIGLMIGNAYSGGLASIMTVPQYEPPIDTAHDLAEHNLEWGATQAAWVFSILLATQPDIVKLVNNFRSTPSELLKRRTKTRDFAFSIERLAYGSFAIGEYIDEEALEYLQLMHRDIYFEYSLAMTVKTWPMKTHLDALISNVVQSGIQRYWERQVVVKYSNSKVQLGVAQSREKHQQSSGPDTLSISRLMGAFVLWLIGVGLSFVVFILEKIIARKQEDTVYVL